jgi:prophage endopeptidase
MIPPQVKLIASLVGAALLVAILFGAGWTVRGWRADAAIEQIKAEDAATAKRLSDAATEASEQARQTERQWVQKVSDLDEQHAKELNDAKQENDRLRAAVDAGSVRLRVHAKCVAAAASSSVPASAAAASVDDGSTVELDAGARQDYFALRAGIEHDQKLILGLQSYVRGVCLAQH